MFNKNFIIPQDEMEFPKKNMRRAIRRKKDFSKGKARLNNRKVIFDNLLMLGNFPESYRNKLNSIHSKSKNKMEFKKMNDIWSSDEEWAPACVRRKVEAMDQREMLYLCGAES